MGWWVGCWLTLVLFYYIHIYIFQNFFFFFFCDFLKFLILILIIYELIELSTPLVDQLIANYRIQFWVKLKMVRLGKTNSCITELQWIQKFHTMDRLSYLHNSVIQKMDYTWRRNAIINRTQLVIYKCNHVTSENKIKYIAKRSIMIRIWNHWGLRNQIITQLNQWLIVWYHLLQPCFLSFIATHKWRNWTPIFHH